MKWPTCTHQVAVVARVIAAHQVSEVGSKVGPSLRLVAEQLVLDFSKQLGRFCLGQKKKTPRKVMVRQTAQGSFTIMHRGIRVLETKKIARIWVS